jgi:hypothetical protein
VVIPESKAVDAAIALAWRYYQSLTLTDFSMVYRFVANMIPCAITGPTSQGSMLLGCQLSHVAAVPAALRLACEEASMRQATPRSPPPFTVIFDIPTIDCAQAHSCQTSHIQRPSTSRQDGAVNKRLGASHSVLLSASSQGSLTKKHRDSARKA